MGGTKVAPVAGQGSTGPVGAGSAWLRPVRDDGTDLGAVERVQCPSGEGGDALGWCQVHRDATDAGLWGDDTPCLTHTARGGHGAEACGDGPTHKLIGAELAGRSLLHCRRDVDDAAAGDTAVLAVPPTAEGYTFEVVDQ